MTGWSLFFVLIGIGYAVGKVFQFVDWIERPAKGRKGGVRV